MTVSLEELRELQLDGGFAYFIHTNLHLHTPATPWDWDGYADQTRKAKDITPQEYFDALNKTTLELVAITDHNSVEWCPSLIELARKGRRLGTSRLHILPGVEITTYEGPHIVVVFDEDQDVEAIRKMLIRMGMSGQGRKDDRVCCLSPDHPKTILDLMAEVDRLNGIIIAPHVQSHDGLWGNSDFRGRTEVLNHPRLRILAAPSEYMKRVEDSLGRVRLLCKNMDSDLIKNSYAFINISDCHRLDDFELNTTWIKMSEPSLEGVRQLIYEPELRVAHELVDTGLGVENPATFRYSTPLEASHPHVIGVAIKGGMLDGQKVALCPHQNCIIGKNYSGKSALLDCLRFALDVVPQEGEALRRFVERLLAILTEGGQVRLYLRASDGRVYGVSRLLSCSKSTKGSSTKWTLEGSPEVFLLLGEEFHRQSNLGAHDILRMEVYPQGEVVKIKDNATRQMTIVDALGRLEGTLKHLTSDEVDGERTLRGTLVDNGREIVRLMGQSDKLIEDTQDIEQLKKEIEHLEGLTSSPLFKEMRQWTDVQVLVDRHLKTLSRLESEWESLDTDVRDDRAEVHEEGVEACQDQNLLGAETVDISAQDQERDESPSFDPASASPEEFSLESDLCFKRTMQSVGNLRKSGLDTVREAKKTLDQLGADAKIRLEAVEESVSKATTLSGGQGLETDLFAVITSKRRRLNGLLDKLQELEGVGRNISQLEEQRTELLLAYRKEWEQVRLSRREIVKRIDDHSAENINAKLFESMDRDEYRKLLEGIADRLTSATNKISNKQAQLDIIANKTTPDELITVVKSGNANELTERAPGVTDNTAKILLGMGKSDLHALELCVLHDTFVIGLRRDGDKVYTPIDSGLSGGEQALALISVAMVPKEIPLVVDQPEDELGPGLITGSLVEQIRKVKPVRQMIFVTHVPNIPVLADSEQIIYIEQQVHDGHRSSRIRHRGSLDHRGIVACLLELDGGDVAFKKRSERYACVVKVGLA